MALKELIPIRVSLTVAFTFGMLGLVFLMACGAVDSGPTPQVQPATAAAPSPAIPQRTPPATAEPVQPATAAAPSPAIPQRTPTATAEPVQPATAAAPSPAIPQRTPTATAEPVQPATAAAPSPAIPQRTPTATAEPVQPATAAAPSPAILQRTPTATAEPVKPATAAAPSPAIPQRTPTAGAKPVQPTPAPPEHEAFVTVGGVSFQVDVALTGERRAQGLSNRDALAPGAGMLFVYSEERKRTFWMKDMRFPLDMIWIAADCTVADITENAPAPELGQSDRDLPRFSPKVPVIHVLEINAGNSQKNGINIGDPVVFSGSLEGLHGC